MAFTTVDGVIAAWNANRGQRIPFMRINSVNGTANVPRSMWPSTGLPAAGSNPTIGKANGRVCVGGGNASPTAGALLFNNASSGATNYLAGVTAANNSLTNATYILCDRIADVQFSASEATGSVTGCTATSRLDAAGGTIAGCQIWLETTTAFNASANTYTLGYTNQAGLGGRTTSVFSNVASSAVGNTILANGCFVPLAPGDTGVRSIDAISVTNNGATGAFNACLVRPLAYLPIGSAGNLVFAFERNFIVESMNMEKIWDDSCLFFVFVPSSSSTPANLHGEIRIVEG